jgi:hypothetical protein
MYGPHNTFRLKKQRTTATAAAAATTTTTTTTTGIVLPTLCENARTSVVVSDLSGLCTEQHGECTL